MKPFTSIWTFLTTERSLPGARPRAQGGAIRRLRKRAQRGIALVTVLIAIAMTLVISNEFGTTTNVDLIAAANYQDQMRSHFLARSAANLSELVIRLQQRLDNLAQTIGPVQITDFADQVLLAFCGSSEEVQAAVGFDPSSAKGLGADIGTCGIVGQITTEDDKINVNCANGNDATAATLKSALDALVFFQAYDPVFEDADAEGYRRDRATLIASIVDYIDSNSLRVRDRGTTEDYGYENLKDDYRPKNNYLDSIGELKLARGVDDRFWSLFGSAFTIYGGCKTNLSALSNSQLIAAILYLAAKNPNDPVLPNPKRLFARAGRGARAQSFRLSGRHPQGAIARDPGAGVDAQVQGSGLGAFAGVPRAVRRAEARHGARQDQAPADDHDGPAPDLPGAGVGRDRAQAEERGRLAGLSGDPLDDQRGVGHEGRPAERP